MKSAYASALPPIRRLGVIGDLHGEHQRLETVLEWLAGQQLDALVCTGDLADGTGCINRSCALLQQAEVITVAGNHDRWLLQNRVRHVAGAHRIEQLEEGNLNYMRSLPQVITLDTVAGPLLLCHGVAGNDLGKVWPGTPRSRIERSAELDALLTADHHRFVINGHMHFRVLIDFQRLLLINAGTLKGPHAGVSIVDFAGGAVTAYDVEAGQRPTLAREHALRPGAQRRVWRDTREFDGSWQPALLYA
ncbi:MAG: metallophosphoesterase family protein [Pseudomonadales bacterium]